MNTQEVATAFAQLCKSGQFDKAGHDFWSDDIVSIEAFPGDMANIKGRAAVEAKGKWWYDNHEIHSAKTEGPYVNGDQFLLRFTLDVTPKGQSRITMDEMGMYTVKGGKVVEERFYAVPGA
jgi:SnoaL-like domain